MSGSALKILHVIPAVAPRYGGPSKLVIEMCAALIQAGHRADIVTSNADGDGVLPLPVHQFITYQGVRCMFFERRLGESFKFAPGMYRWLRNYVNDYDLVHIHGIFSWSSYAASRACQQRSIPYILRPLGSLDPWALKRKPIRKKVLRWIYVRRMVRNACQLHFTSAREQKASASYLRGVKSVVIPNAVKFSEFESVKPREINIQTFADILGSQFILFLGRLDPKKKLELLIRSFSQLPGAEKYKLVIAGDGENPYVSRLKSFTRTTPTSERVAFVGWVKDDLKILLLKSCELFVLISENENYGISVAEAMASGRAVVVNKEVYISDQIQQAGAGWVIGDDSELTDVLDTALRDHTERNRRGERGRNLVRDRYSWNTVICRLESVYLDCTNVN